MTEKLKVLDLFSGIGGFSLGLERTGGFETVAFCEIEEFPRRVLNKHWPEVPCYHDVRKLTADVLNGDGISVDVITGGFPCQDISVSGRQAGIGSDTRSGLWSEIIRLIRQLRPKFVIVENVANLLRGPSNKPGAWFGRVLGDLAECGYDAEWQNIPASSIGAPHRRERVWIVAYPRHERIHQRGEHDSLNEARKGQAGICRDGIQRREKREILADSDCVDVQRLVTKFINKEIWERSEQRQAGSCGNVNRWWATESGVGRVANGVPNRSHRLKGLGNSVVPQIPELIGNAILRSMRND